MTSNVNLRKLTKDHTIVVKVTTTKEYRFRVYLATILFKLAATVLGCGIELTHD